MKLPRDIISKYKSNEKEYGFPNSTATDPESKGKDYLLNVAQSIFQRFVRNKTGIHYNMYPIWEDNRLYGSEQQYTNIYRRTFDPDNSTTNTNPTSVPSSDEFEASFDQLQKKRRGEVALDYSIISLAKRIKDTVHGMYDDVDWDVSINIVDVVHKYEEKYQKYKLFNEVLFKNYYNKWRTLSNTTAPNHKYLPKSEQELDAYAANDGFKLNTAISLEKLLKHTFNISGWDDVKYKFIDDALDLGVVGAKEYYDIEEECIKARYSDPSSCGVQFNENNDFDDSDYAFEIKMYPISKLSQQGFDRSELFNVAKKYQGAFGNPIKGEWGRFDFYDTSVDDFEYFQVPVMEFEVIETDCEYQTVWNDSHGQPRIMPGKFGEYIDGENKKTRVFQYRKKYEGKWIIDTDLIFDYGASKQQYKYNKKPRLSWKFIKITDKPLIERLKPVFDDMMHAWIKYQKASILASNSGYAINVRLLQNIQMGDVDWTPDMILEFMRETGYLLYSDTDDEGEYKGGEVRPVHEIPGGMKQILEDSVSRFQMSVNMVESITGLNLVAMGATPHPDVGKKVTEYAIQGTVNAIKPVSSGIRKLKKLLSKGLSEKIRLFIRTEPKMAIKTYGKVVGITDLYALKIADDTAAEYGLDFEPKASDEDKIEILRAAEIALAPGKDGKSMIKFQDWLNIKQLISVETNLKVINQIIAYQVEKYEELNEQRARAAQMENAKLQEQHDNNIAAREEAKDVRVFEKEITINDRKTLNKIKEIEAEGKIKKELLEKELEFKKYDENLNHSQEIGKK